MKCTICGKEVDEKYYEGDNWNINGAIMGEYIAVTGHKRCCEAVNNLVVIPNRIRFMSKLNSN